MFLFSGAYFLMMLMALGGTSIFTMLVLLEMLSWLFISLIKEVSLKYLVVQSFFFLISLISLVWWLPLFMMSVVLKIGLPPLQSWALHLFSFLKKEGFLFMTTIHKLLPIFILTKMFSLISIVFLALLVLVLSLSWISQGAQLFLILSFSSMMHSGWLLFSSYFGTGIYLLYWTLYGSLTVVLLLGVVSSTLMQGNLSQSSTSSFCWLAISGLPPFIIFWLKLIVLSGLILLASTWTFLLMGTVVLSVLAYLRNLFLSMLLSDSLAVLFLWLSLAAFLIL